MHFIKSTNFQRIFGIFYFFGEPQQRIIRIRSQNEVEVNLVFVSFYGFCYYRIWSFFQFWNFLELDFGRNMQRNVIFGQIHDENHVDLWYHCKIVKIGIQYIMYSLYWSACVSLRVVEKVVGKIVKLERKFQMPFSTTCMPVCIFWPLTAKKLLGHLKFTWTIWNILILTDICQRKAQVCR